MVSWPLAHVLFQAKRIHEKVERHVEELREKGELPARKVLLQQFVHVFIPASMQEQPGGVANNDCRYSYSL